MEFKIGLNLSELNPQNVSDMPILHCITQKSFKLVELLFLEGVLLLL